MIFFLLVNSEYVHSWSDTNKIIRNCNICHLSAMNGACSDKLSVRDCVMCRCLTVVAELQLHWHSRKHTEIHREEERGVVICCYSPPLLSLPSSNTLRPSSPANRLSQSLSHTHQRTTVPSVCSPPKRMQSRSKEIQIRTALMQPTYFLSSSSSGWRMDSGPLWHPAPAYRGPQCAAGPLRRQTLNGASVVGGRDGGESEHTDADWLLGLYLHLRTGLHWTELRGESRVVLVWMNDQIIVCLSKVCRGSCAVSEMGRRVQRCCGNR